MNKRHLMWILKNSKELLVNLKTHDFSKIDSIKTLFLHTLYNNSSQQIKISAFSDHLSFLDVVGAITAPCRSDKLNNARYDNLSEQPGAE
jgi:hypothetical protein